MSFLPGKGFPAVGYRRRRRLTPKKRQSQLHGLAAKAKPLRTIIIGQPGATQSLHDCGNNVGIGHIVDEYAEAVTMQMAGTKFVSMSADLEKADAVALDLMKSIVDRGWNGDHLPSDGMAIFHAGRAYVTNRDVEAARDLAEKIFRAHGALFHPEIEELALAARLVSRHLLDFKILRRLLDPTPDA